MKVYSLRNIFTSALFCVALVCQPVMAAATPEPDTSPSPTVSETPETTVNPSPSVTETPGPSASPAPSATPTPPPTPAPTINIQELLNSAELPDYGIMKEGDSGDNVLLLQRRLRDLGYFTYKETSDFGAVTKESVKRFQKVNGLDQDGIVGGQTSLLLFENYALRAPIANPRIPTTAPPKPKAHGTLIEWKKVLAMTKRGDVYKVKDYRSGTEYNMVRVGGHNHMDVEPKTKKDCEKLKSTYGGSWSWARRPVLVRIGGKWYAASTNGMPHGYETVRNNGMVGQVCIHFLNSRTHGSEAIDSAHQRCVKEAAGK